MSSGRGRSPCDTGPREFRLDVVCPGTLAAPSRRNDGSGSRCPALAVPPNARTYRRGTSPRGAGRWVNSAPTITRQGPVPPRTSDLQKQDATHRSSGTKSALGLAWFRPPPHHGPALPRVLLPHVSGTLVSQRWAAPA